LGQRRSGKFLQTGLDRGNHIDPLQQIRRAAEADDAVNATINNATSQTRIELFQTLSFRGSPNGAEPGIQGFPEVQLHI
jgi:hypothetical protein